MKCELCDKVALYKGQGKKVYCKDHREVAVEQMKAMVLYGEPKSVAVPNKRRRMELFG